MNAQTINMTDEEKMAFNAKKKSAADAYKARRNEAKSVVSEYLASNPKLDPKVLEAIKYLSGQGSPRSASVNNELLDFLAEPRTSMQIYKKFEYGKPTMDQKIRAFIKKAPESRVWVQFENGTYSIAGTGENAPEGWTGYIPAVKTEL